MEQHIDHHFDESLAELKRQILLMGKKVQAMLADCMTALVNRDARLANMILEADRAIDALEISIDEQCVQLLARYQPAATDLRFITRGLKIVTDIERIGDLAVNISQRVLNILELGDPGVDLSKMAAETQGMFGDSLDAFVTGDVQKAINVLNRDDIVDDLTQKHVQTLLDRATKEPMSLMLLFPVTSIVRYLERIADHATNIAELVIFMVQGRDVRHGRSL